MGMSCVVIAFKLPSNTAIEWTFKRFLRGLAHAVHVERWEPPPKTGHECYDATMIDWSSCPAVESDPERVSGAWVFRGTRVPVAALFENLEDGVPVGQFVELFPGVTLEQARAVLEHAARSALTAA
jgi:uncharacterized protein (DUF433 family)